MRKIKTFPPVTTLLLVALTYGLIQVDAPWQAWIVLLLVALGLPFVVDNSGE